MGLAEPNLGGIESEVRSRGRVVSDALPADGGERDEDPVKPKPDLQRGGPSSICNVSLRVRGVEAG